MKPMYLPTPKQIRKACLAIQAEWTPAEKWRRSVCKTEYETRIAHSALDDHGRHTVGDVVRGWG